MMSAAVNAMAATPPDSTTAEPSLSSETIAEPNAAELLAGLLAKTTAMQAHFKHVMYDIDGEVVDESNGLMAWQKPDKFRWDIIEPIEQSIVVDGDTYYQLDTDLDQLIIETVTPEITGLTSILLGGDAASIAADFNVKHIVAVAAGAPQYATNTKQDHRFELRPLGDDAVFISAMLVFDGSFLKLLAIEDDLNNISRFEFFLDDSPKVVNDATFELQTTQSTEIIRQ